MELPRSLFCLTLSHSIDDKDIIEQLLIDFPEEMEQCIPIALRTMLASGISQTRREVSGLPETMFEVDYLPPTPLLSNSELLNYLSLLWNDEASDTKLYNAATDGLIYLVAYYLNMGANIHAIADAALRFAAYCGHTDTVILLLDRKADIHAMDDSALSNAAGNGHVKTVKLLLDRKADIHSNDEDALKSAAQEGHIKIVKLLLDRNADIHAIDGYILGLTESNGQSIWSPKGDRNDTSEASTDTVKLLIERNAVP